MCFLLKKPLRAFYNYLLTVREGNESLLQFSQLFQSVLIILFHPIALYLQMIRKKNQHVISRL